MDNKNFDHEKLNELLEKGDIGEVLRRSQGEKWDTLPDTDRDDIADKLLSFAQRDSTRAPIGAKSLLSIASTVAPYSPEVLFEQGELAISQASNLPQLLDAEECYRKAIQLDPNRLRSRMGLGHCLVRKGTLNGNFDELEEAQQTYADAAALMPSIEDESYDAKLLGELYWQWALCFYHIGRLSGEASDYTRAAELYQSAVSQGIATASFWNDYGNALGALAELVSHDQVLHAAAQTYRKAILMAPRSAEAWVNLAETLHRLYELGGAEKVFQDATNTYNRAAGLRSNSAQLWMRWGQLLTLEGRYTENEQALELALTKFSTASTLAPDLLGLHRSFAEALMELGSQRNSIQLLREAQDHLNKALELEPEESENNFVFGRCLMEQGSYFDDAGYYEAAIKHFQSGASSDQKARYLHVCGECYAAIGMIRQSVVILEQAMDLFEESSKIDASIPELWHAWGITTLKVSEIRGIESYIIDAVNRFQEAVRLLDNKHINVEFLLDLGASLDYLGDFQDHEENYGKAVEILSAALVADPSNIDVRFALALALTHLGGIMGDKECAQKGIELFKSVVSEDRDNEFVWNEWGSALINIGMMLDEPIHEKESKAYLKEAERVLRQAAQLENHQALFNLSCLYSLQGNIDLALTYLHKAESCKALPGLEELLTDEWFSAVRDTQEGQAVIQRVREAESA